MEWSLFLKDNADIFFFLATIEAIVIAGFVVYLFFKRDNDNEKKDVEYASDFYNNKNKEVDYWRNAFLDADRKLKALKSDNSQSDQKNKKRYVMVSNETERESPVNKGYEAMLKKAKESRNRLIETTNNDGTLKSEIEFEITNNETVSDSSDERVTVTFTPKFEYLEAANGGQFRKLLPTDEKSFFRTWEENGIRKFEFHGSVEKALANINAIFDDVCEIEGKQSGATQIINVEPGVLSNQLIVETKAKIKLT